MNLRIGDNKPILLIVGDFEAGDPLPRGLIEELKSHPNVRLVGFHEAVAPYYHLMDIFVFPSYREGLPTAPLEAALAGVPTVGYAATGVRDAVISGETGILVPVGSVKDLEMGIRRLFGDERLRTILGENARRYALNEFSPERAWNAWLEFYSQRLAEI